MQNQTRGITQRKVAIFCAGALAGAVFGGLIALGVSSCGGRTEPYQVTEEDLIPLLEQESLSNRTLPIPTQTPEKIPAHPQTPIIPQPQNPEPRPRQLPTEREERKKGEYQHINEESQANNFSYTDLKGQITRHEGIRFRAYTDTTGHRTVGIGFNLEGTTARRKVEALGLNYQEVYSGKTTLTPEQVNKLLDWSIATAYRDANNYTGKSNFGGLESEAKRATIDLAFNLGSKKLNEFGETKRAIQKRDYTSAARHIKDSKWYNQVGNRGRDLVDQMRKAEEAKTKARELYAVNQK